MTPREQVESILNMATLDYIRRGGNARSPNSNRLLSVLVGDDKVSFVRMRGGNAYRPTPASFARLYRLLRNQPTTQLRQGLLYHVAQLAQNDVRRQRQKRASKNAPH